MTQTQFPRPFDTHHSTQHHGPTVAIAIHNLTFAYSDSAKILDQVNLSIATGERVGVIGPNGAGKTTLFMTLCGVFKPSEGTVTVFGEPIVPGQFRPDIGLVFQNPDDQLFASSVRDDVAFGPENMGLSQEEIDVRVREALDLTGMSHHVDRPPHHLSGGEKRMVAIAGVIAMLPRLVIYDEPSANLDMRSRRRLIQFLQTSHETMLISSHDLEFILEVCDRVILLDGGAIVADGHPREVMSNADLMLAHGLEKPHSLIPHTDPHHD
ncbi:MAG: ABC transporter ATP-binding protein [Leptolyngbyaceae bacterium]|nr:ABC transporter ATP-binding protein [Leptolyngbyaceae bacterium]